MTIRIGSDVDDVLTDWYYTSHEYSNRAGINYNKVVKPTLWACHEEYGAQLDEWLEAVYRSPAQSRTSSASRTQAWRST
jgi:hypothetical protein